MSSRGRPTSDALAGRPQLHQLQAVRELPAVPAVGRLSDGGSAASGTRLGRVRSIASPRLLLRPWENGDAGFLFDLESRWETVRYLGPQARRMTDEEEAAESIERRRAVDHPVHGIWAVTRGHDGALLGNLLLKPIPLSTGALGAPPVEIGWHFHPSAQGCGYATEAAGAVMADAAKRGLGSVVAVTDPRNAASQRVCARLDMDDRGLTADYYDKTNRLFSKDLL